MTEHGMRALYQTRAKDRISEVGGGFLNASDGIATGLRTGAKAVELRKYEPHPVSLLAAPFQLRERLIIRARVGINKTI